VEHLRFAALSGNKKVKQKAAQKATFFQRAF
jgi:hypothetical protein